jgi:hypothetical protein
MTRPDELPMARDVSDMIKVEIEVGLYVAGNHMRLTPSYVIQE